MKFPKTVLGVGGFSLVEVTAVAVMIGILVGAVCLMVGTSRNTTLSARIQTDLESLNMAKKLWQLDNANSGAAFPSSESSRFSVLLPYLQSQRALTNLADMTPSGKTYTIGPVGTSATATP